MKIRALFSALTLVLAPAAGAQVPETVSAPGRRQVVLTFDDIPLGQGQPGTRCNRESLLAINQRITAALVEVGAPSAAFITTGNVCEQLRDQILGDVMRTWSQAGAVIGNHGHRHLSLSRVSLSEYTADLTLADSILRAHGSQGVELFRHPFLHTGADSARSNGIDRWLREHHYTVAPVTIDNNEWVYARAYSIAIARRDSAMMRRLVPAYLEHMDQAFAFAESMSVRVLGEEIPQILLLHVNELNRDHIEAVLAVISRRGYSFISLDKALGHPAYRRPTYYYGPWGISWLLRWSPDSTVWRMDLPRTEAWVD